MFSFNSAFEAPSGSPIRELFKYLARPGMISFAGGYPASDLFDRAGLDAAAARASQQPTLCLQYGPTDGIAILKEQLAQLMARRGTPCAPTDLLVTTGSQQGFDLLLRVMVAPGDVVLVEQPAYPATLQALKLQQADVVTVPVDQHGLDVAKLAAVLETGTLRRAPKLLNTVPTFANPTGATLSLERRIALLKLAARYRFVIVEDDPYGDLRFDGTAVPSLFALSERVPGSRDWVVHLSSLSKIVAPGWSGICRALCDALDTHLARHIAFHRPAGGMFVWARLNAARDASDYLRVCIEQNVMFVPGVAFYKDAADRAALRLSFAAPGVEEIETGVHRMNRALEQYCDEQ
ncbi:PLP-dependent aminotransferase family protein [Paraburkholderia sp. MM5384-R2]|uniref:aminotransferase-like domain-containing protein n=1 Tax=Paraburkholderia sp. MM5384-R2 TaxID=2723097 RepID=UPI00160DEC3F|nr:PLP-dependent aminotransferase family protein [Paraburkholderia sp. MM5384-R2]MBB5503544.1 DNA-binding transcriptional MocR family regulator [Paraburkholderia sp. MM5384-R2]